MSHNPLVYAGSVAVLGVAMAIGLVAREAASTLRAWATLPTEVAALRVAIDGLPGRVLPLVVGPVLREVDGLGKGVIGEVAALRADTMARVDAIERDANARAGEALGKIDGIQADVKPVLVNSAALIKNANDSWDDLYWDVKALVGSVTVAGTQVAQAAETATGTLPVFLGNAQRTNSHLAGITGDVHSMTTEIDRRYFHPPPQSFKQRVWGGFKSAVYVGAGVARVAR